MVVLEEIAVKDKLEEIQKTDINNEKTAIGYMLQDEAAGILASKVLQEKYFITPYAVHVLKLIKAATEKGESISDIYVKVCSIVNDDWQELAPELKINKSEYLQDCITRALPFIGNIAAAEGTFKKIQDQYLRRKVFYDLNNSLDKVLNTSGSEDLRETVFEISNKANNSIDDLVIVNDKPYRDVLLDVLHKKKQDAISTGFDYLDEIIGGFRPGELVTIGAGTGVGKSAFAINIMLNIAANNHAVALWSFEMDINEIVQRVFSIKSGFTEKTKRHEERYNACREYANNTHDKINIFTEPVKDLSSFYLQCRKLSIQKEMRVVIIDYLQLIHLNRDYGTNRVGEIEYITNTLKSFASQLQITIVILSQLSRSYQKREDKTPMLSDLRDSGSIEQDSNIVIFMHKLEVKPMNFKEYESYIELIVAKNRSGRCGSFFMKYTGYITKFLEIKENNNAMLAC
jgi:replicative DNA helicase